MMVEEFPASLVKLSWSSLLFGWEMIGSQEWCQLYNNLPFGFASFLFLFFFLSSMQALCNGAGYFVVSVS